MQMPEMAKDVFMSRFIVCCHVAVKPQRHEMLPPASQPDGPETIS